MAQEPIVLSEIKNIEDLKKILKFLSDQGFNVSESGYSLNEYKINRIIDGANKLGVKIPNRADLFDEISKLGNYSDMINAANNYFSKFSSKDKIKEYITTFYVQDDESCSVPSHSSPSTKDVIEWFNFKTKHNLNDNFRDTIHYYNLDKNILKIRFGNNNSDFEKFYKLIYNENCNEITTSFYGKKIGPGQVDYNKYGIWQNLGKIEIKFLQNGNVNLKGDLTDIREYNYQYLLDRVYGTHIIKYKGKTEIIKAKKED